jgi:hypothetical protein
MGSIPLLDSLWDPRNLYTALFYPLYFLLILRCFTQVQPVQRERESGT